MAYPRRQIEDIEAALAPRLDQAITEAGIRKGQTVGIGVGSRCIDRLPELVGMTCRKLRNRGVRSVIIPAMGSHGGADPKGQERVLSTLGVTDACGAPSRSSMETVDRYSPGRGTGVVFKGRPGPRTVPGSRNHGVWAGPP